jgi:hypothetical protein
MKKLPARTKLSLETLLFLSFVFATSILGQGTGSEKLSPREIARRVLPSMVSIVMESPHSKKAKGGSGFFVSDNVIATNHHVIEGETTGYVKLYGRDETFRISSVIGDDVENDLALLKIEGATGQPLSLSLDDITAIGDIIFAVGSPKGLEGTFSQGIVSSIRDLSGHHYLQITAAISPGSSGGPVLNDAGEVVGVAKGAISAGQSLNFAIPVSLLRSLVFKKISSVTYQAASPVAQQQYQYIPYMAANKSLGFSFQVHPMIQQFIDYYGGHGRTTMETGLYRSGMFMWMARRIFREEGVPENVAWLGQVESAWKPSSLKGLWGLEEQSARKLGLNVSLYVDERNNFDEATRAVARYLKFLANRYGGNWELAIAGYNSGQEQVDEAIRRAGVANFWVAYPYLPAETRNCVPKILATILIANNPNQYGFGNIRPAIPLRYDRIRVPASTTLSLLASASGASVEYLRLLNPHLRSDVTPPEPYIVNVPVGKASEIVALFRGSESEIKNISSVEAGETWQTLSNRTGVSIEELKAANPGMKVPKGKVFVPVKPRKEP